MISATPRQLELLRFIHGHIEAKGRAPSVRECAIGLGLKVMPTGGHQSTHFALKRLEERGHIRRLPNRARAIEVLHKPAIPRDPQGKPLYFVKAPS